MPSPTDRVAHYSKILLKEDDSEDRASAWLGLGTAHEAAGDLKEACSAYTHYVQLASKDPKGWRKLADVAELVGRWDVATQAWQKIQVLSQAAASREAGLRARLCRTRLCLEKTPQDPKLLLALGDTQRALGQSDPAIQSYKAAMDSDPTEVQAWWGYASASQDAGDLATATHVWQKMLDLPLSKAHRSQVERKLKEVELLAQISSSETPDSMVKLAGVYFNSKEPEKALAWIDKALLIEKRPPWFRARAMCLEDLSRWQEAAEAWRAYAAVETEEKGLKTGLDRWVSATSSWVKEMRARGQYGPCLDVLESLDGNPDFPEELRSRLLQESLRSMTAFEDLFPMGNVDLKWQRERGSWVINRAQLEGSDGRLWTKERFKGPLRATVQVTPDIQYTGRPGIALCVDPEKEPTAGVWFVFGTDREPAKLYRPGKTFQDVPDAVATPGQTVTMEIRWDETGVEVFQGKQRIAALQGSMAMLKPGTSVSIALIAEDGLVLFDDFRVYSLGK